MKRKVDFVTNSSSTSFVVWGTTVSSDELRENKQLLETAYGRCLQSKYFDKTVTFDQFCENFEEYKYEFMENLPIGNTKIEISFGPSGDGEMMIGGSPENMRADQTLKEYKEEIISVLTGLGFKVNKLSFICESWYDG